MQTGWFCASAPAVTQFCAVVGPGWSGELPEPGYRVMVLRLALRPKWLALLVLALAIASAFAALGSWQLDRSRENATPVIIGAPKPLDTVLQPQQHLPPDAATTPVIISGTLEPDLAVVVDGRRHEGQEVNWLVAPIAVDQPAGARIAVVLGWFPLDDTPPVVAEVHVELTAMLQPSEEPAAATANGDTSAVSGADLVARWQPPIYSGFVFGDEALLAQIDAPPALGVVPAPVIEPSRSFAVLNLSYAVQWWIFAIIAVFLWWRLLRDAYHDEQPGTDHPRDDQARGDQPRDDQPSDDQPSDAQPSVEPTMRSASP